MDNAKTGKFITILRKQKGFTQQELADKLKISNATVSKWETGRGFPDISLIEPLAKALDTTVADILAGEAIRSEQNDITGQVVTDLVELSISEQDRKHKIYNWAIAISVAILYLTISFITMKWSVTWIIWLAYCFYRIVSDYLIKR